MSAQEELSRLFGSYRAEWLREQIFDYFSEPSYFPELQEPRPCILLGGRGTGKTTVLRSMSYEGRFALAKQDAAQIKMFSYYGFYHRVNTNRVQAFTGPEKTEEQWTRLFAHYLNLLLVDLVLEFLLWYQRHHPKELCSLTTDSCKLLCKSLHLPQADTVPDFSRALRLGIVAFEAAINNIVDSTSIKLSLQGAPIDLLFAALTQIPCFAAKHFFFLIDEYENLDDYQQRVVNTLIKHSGDSYTFKIGVKELGMRCRTTLNANEQLVSPADYVRIPIKDKLTGERFISLVLKICNTRLAHALGSSDCDLRTLFPDLSEDREALILDAEGNGEAAQCDKQIREVLSPYGKDIIAAITPLKSYYLVHWADHESWSLSEMARRYALAPEVWDERFLNYKHALLFGLKAGKSGIRKYYCGWETFAKLAAENIRFFMELIHQTLMLHFERNGKLDEPIPPKTQTEAAMRVGKKNLSELEGLNVSGSKLTRLLLSLGRVFQVMAADPFGHTPEVTQFHMSESEGELPDTATSLLNAAIDHLALVRYAGSKLSDDTDTRDYDYSIHPIFSAYFVYSYRRKRKLSISSQQLLGLVDNHKQTIRSILASSGRKDDIPLPEQLMLFQSYYA